MKKPAEINLSAGFCVEIGVTVADRISVLPYSRQSRFLAAALMRRMIADFRPNESRNIFHPFGVDGGKWNSA